MTDSYPESFPIEIEREKLCRYWRLEALLTLLFFGAFLGTQFGLVSATNRHAMMELDSWITIPLRMGIGLLIGSTIAVVIYGIVGHYLSRLRVNRLEISVEKQYFHFSEGVFVRSDRKLHFRSIVDYSCFSGPLMRFCGIEGLMLTTTAGGRYSTIRLKGIKNALEIRDVLSEIDAQRENS
jgi:membrane protein YdbS with pleckstrin-like domain